MADIETTLRTHLLADAGLAAKIGTRCYPVQLPQQPTLPALAYLRVSMDPVQHRSSAQAGAARSRYQFDVWGATHQSAQETATALIAALGTFVETGTPRVDVALLENVQDGIDETTKRRRVIVEAFIWHTTP